MTRRRIVPAMVAVLVAAACSGGNETAGSTTIAPPLTTAPPATTTTDPAAQADRVEDVDYLYRRINEIHPNPFWQSDESEYLAQVDAIRAGAGDMTDEEFGIAIIRLAALIDGHSLAMTNSPPLDFRRFQIRTYDFEDGLFVLNSHDPAAIGGRVIAIGGVPTAEAVERIEPYIHRDNTQTVRLITPIYLTYIELLEGIGILSDGAPAYTVETAEGSILELDPPRLSSDEMVEWLGGSPGGLSPRADRVGSPSAAPLYLSDPNRAFWWTYLEDSRTVYIQMNQVTDASWNADGTSVVDLEALADEIGSFVGETAVERVVLDLRHNGGGDNGTYWPLLNLLSGHPMINQEGKLFVIAGRRTFSAAMNLATEIENETKAIYAGEPTGSLPNLYGDTATVHLPNSAIAVRISARYWPFGGPDDTRIWIEPTIDVPLTSDDYFAGRDPVLDAVIAYQG